MKTVTLFVTIGLLLLCDISCNENSASGPANSGPSFTFQSSHCLGTALAKTDILDSSFVYTFSDTLTVDFAVKGNCCPDSARFDVAHSLEGDTLFIAVTDTGYNICRCICTYFIHTELTGLPNDHYVVRCTMTYAHASDPGNDIVYLVDVYRAR